MIPPIGPGTRLLALLGDPVAHSLSPSFQNAALRASGADAVYLALRCAADALPGLLTGIARAGGAGNVTVPHKALAAATVERPSAAVRRTGACNCFWLEDGAVQGDNTDVVGVAAAVAELLGEPPTGARVLLIGAGGAAAAALAALADAGAGPVTLVNRSPDRAAELVRHMDLGPARARVAPSAAAVAGERFDLAIHATSLGLRDDDALPLSPEEQPRVGAALDLVYRLEETAWVHAMRAAGVPAADGLGMLLHQGAAAWERWWGAPAPLDAMRAALPRREPAP